MSSSNLIFYQKSNQDGSIEACGLGREGDSTVHRGVLHDGARQEGRA
jgi:hypothetical protein